MIRRPPISTRTDTSFPYTTLFRSADATSEVILHLGSRLVNGLGKQAQLRFLLGEMSSETVPVAVEQRDPDDRCRLEDEADGAARVTLLDTAHHVARQDRKSTRLNSSHSCAYRKPSSA